MMQNSILRLPRCRLSLLADSAVEQTATVYKVPDRDEYLRHLLDHLKETPQQQSSNAMASTIQMVLWRRTQVDFYTDGWPQFTSIAARIRSPTVADVILFTSRKERLLELLRDDLILRCPGSHNNGGVIISDPENPVAWILTYPFGQIGHLYVLKEHRRKGLAGIVMADLCKKVNGTVPDVMSNNEHAIRAAKAIGFVECGQCIRLIYTCTKRSRLVSIKDALLRWPDTSQDEYAHRLESCHE
eukprot:Em0014g743a